MTAPVPAVELLRRHRIRPEALPTGIPEFDRLLAGLPRGVLTEITGPRSSGRATFLAACLARAALLGECCALVDAAGGFDPASASASGLDLARLLWIRCGGNAASALKSADLLLHGGGFGLVCLDLAGADPRDLNRIPPSYWFRFRRAVQDTPAVFLVLGEEPAARSSSACWLEFETSRPVWSGHKHFRLLRGAETHLRVHKPGPPARLVFHSSAV